jgi:hypothetical protein
MKKKDRSLSEQFPVSAAIDAEERSARAKAGPLPVSAAINAEERDAEKNRRWRRMVEMQEEQDAWDNPQPGQRMPDGTLCAGISPITEKPMFVPAKDGPDFGDWHAFMAYIENLNRQGPQGDWRPAYIEELAVTRGNMDRGHLKGTFNASGMPVGGSYWGAEFDQESGDPEDPKNRAIMMDFRTGSPDMNLKSFGGGSFRCVRS